MTTEPLLRKVKNPKPSRGHKTFLLSWYQTCDFLLFEVISLANVLIMDAPLIHSCFLVFGFRWGLLLFFLNCKVSIIAHSSHYKFSSNSQRYSSYSFAVLKAPLADKVTYHLYDQSPTKVQREEKINTESLLWYNQESWIWSITESPFPLET